MMSDSTEFEWPREVQDLDQVPPEWRGAYEPYASGYRLLSEIAEARAEAEAAFESELSERDAKIEQLRSETDRLRATNKDLLIESTIDAVLRQRGVSDALRAAALAFLIRDLDAEVRDGRAYVADDFGERPLSAAVHDWLNGPGVAFLPPSKPETGPCAEAMARLRQTLH